jgi:hypothetical protein
MGERRTHVHPLQQHAPLWYMIIAAFLSFLCFPTSSISGQAGGSYLILAFKLPLSVCMHHDLLLVKCKSEDSVKQNLHNCAGKITYIFTP